MSSTNTDCDFELYSFDVRYCNLLYFIQIHGRLVLGVHRARIQGVPVRLNITKIFRSKLCSVKLEAGTINGGTM